MSTALRALLPTAGTSLREVSEEHSTNLPQPPGRDTVRDFAAGLVVSAYWPALFLESDRRGWVVEQTGAGRAHNLRFLSPNADVPVAGTGEAATFTTQADTDAMRGLAFDEGLQRFVRDSAVGEVERLLRKCGRHNVAEGLGEVLEDLREEDEWRPIAIDSLVTFAQIFAVEDRLPVPVIGVNPGGNVQAEWSVMGSGLVVIECLPDGFMRFVGISAPATENRKRKRIQGTLPSEEGVDAIVRFPGWV